MALPLFRAVDATAEHAPDRPAIRCAGRELTYAELAQRSDRLARLLIEEGVQRGDRVGIHAGKGLAAATAIYGIMKAGAAYVPLDPTAPPERQSFILRDCGVRHLVSEPARARALRDLLAFETPVECVMGVEGSELHGTRALPWGSLDGAQAGGALPEIRDDDLSYILYTSGSTGTPKGVVHTHASAVAFARVAAETYGLKGSDRVSNHAPLHFDLSTLDYFATALAGATTVVIPDAYTKLPASFTKLVEEERLTVLYAVPLALTQMLLHGAMDKRDLSSVRWVLFGGEPFPPKHLRALMEALPGARFSNVYGPTEVNGVTWWPVAQMAEGDDDPIPIGVTYQGVDARIVDEDDHPVTEGGVGELVVSTPTMMRGYWNRPELDAKAFLCPADTDAVYYRTGDLVRRRPDGLLDFLGRKDRQIKARGYRVELDEVEAALLTHPSVAAGAAFAVSDRQGSRRIEAALTLVDGHVYDADDLRDHLARFLPPYALPEHMAVLEAMPRTSSGKIDRLALARAAEARTSAQDGA